MTFSDLQLIEIVHLTFLGHLGRKVDKTLFALKGGCNLRFFFKSVRYSEDIDFDLKITSKETLKKNVGAILEAQSFKGALKAKGIEITNISDAKQTDTTQRWKLLIERASVGRQISTKIEFSRREFKREAVYEKVDPEISSFYGLTPTFTNHYPGTLAFEQKVKALVGRAETQARDVFDIDLLISGKHNVGTHLKKGEANTAIERALALSYDEYKGQVVAYLASEYVDDMGSKAYWNEMQNRVVKTLQRLSK